MINVLKNSLLHFEIIISYIMNIKPNQKCLYLSLSLQNDFIEFFIFLVLSSKFPTDWNIVLVHKVIGKVLKVSGHVIEYTKTSKITMTNQQKYLNLCVELSDFFAILFIRVMWYPTLMKVEMFIGNIYSSTSNKTIVICGYLLTFETTKDAFFSVYFPAWSYLSIIYQGREAVWVQFYWSCWRNERRRVCLWRF